jgi:hypothetical protein
MENPKDALAREITIYLQKNGIDPIYAGTLFSILIVFSYKNDIKNWDKLKGWQKGIIKSTIFGTIVMIVISILRLTGLITL